MGSSLVARGVVRPLVRHDAPLLRQVAPAVSPTSPEVAALAADLIATLEAHGALGIAAPQIGVSARLCVISGQLTPTRDPWVLVNPEIVAMAGYQRGVEGCLSLPGVAVEVERAAHLTLHYETLAGTRQTVEADRLLATCIQHEVDHLHGRLILDRLSWTERQVVLHQLGRR